MANRKALLEAVRIKNAIVEDLKKSDDPDAAEKLPAAQAELSEAIRAYHAERWPSYRVIKAT